MISKEKSIWDSLTPEEQQEFWNGMSQSEQIAFAQDMKTSVAGDFVSPPSTGYSARMKKKVLGVAMVVVFCLTFWIVAGEALRASLQTWQVARQAWQASDQADQAYRAYEQADRAGEAWQAYEQADLAYGQAGQELLQDMCGQAGKEASQAKQASIMADARWRTQAPWGIGAGLYADVVLLVGVLAWSKLTAKA